MSARRILESYEAASRLIDDIFLERSDWSALSGFLVERYPGTFSAVINIRPDAGSLDILSGANIDHGFRNSFQNYYCKINPWNEVWMKPRAPILVTEAEAPAKFFAGTEFYEDWLRPQKHFDAGVGMRIAYAESSVLYLTVHQPTQGHGNHQEEVAQVFRLLHRDLRFRLDFANDFSARSESAIAASMVDNHGAKPTLIIDRDFRIREANAPAILELRSAMHIRERAGKLSFLRPDHQRAATLTVAALMSGTQNVKRLFLRTGSTTLVVRASLVRSRQNNMALTAERSPAILITFVNVGETTLVAGDVARDLGEAFRLTEAELMLCQELASGLTVTEAARKLHIMESTARQRLKSILAKTGTSRQSELMRLMLA